MTTTTTTSPVTTGYTDPAVDAREGRLRAVLRLAAVLTAADGALALLAPGAYGLPERAVTVTGAVLLLVGLDLGLASRWSGRRLGLAGVVLGEAALAWAVALVAVELLADVGEGGALLLLAGAAVNGALGVLALRRARALR